MIKNIVEKQETGPSLLADAIEAPGSGLAAISPNK